MGTIYKGMGEVHVHCDRCGMKIYCTDSGLVTKEDIDYVCDDCIDICRGKSKQ